MRFVPDAPLSGLHWLQNRIDPQVAALAAEIQASGFIYPIIADHAGEVTDGRRRCAACEMLGRSSIPAIMLDPGEVADPAQISLISNTHRLQLTPMDLLRQLQAEIAELRSPETGPDPNSYSPQHVKRLAATVNLSIDDTFKLLTFSRCAPEIQQLVQGQAMPLNVAILTTNLDDKKRAAFADWYRDCRPSYREAKAWFRENKGALDLREALFDSSACQGCACHGDANPALFEVEGSLGADGHPPDSGIDDDRCFNLACWHEKTSAFKRELKDRSQKQGLLKAGVSIRNLWDASDLTLHSEAKPKDPGLCCECKLVKWLHGRPTKGKWLLYCPMSCPNLPGGRANGHAPEMDRMTTKEKMAKGLLTPAEKKEQIERACRKTAADLAYKDIKASLKKVTDPLRLFKALMILQLPADVTHLKVAQLPAMKLPALRPFLLAGFTNPLIDWRISQLSMVVIDVLMEVLFGSGSSGRGERGVRLWSKANTAAIAAALPPEIKALLPSATNVPFMKRGTACRARKRTRK